MEITFVGQYIDEFFSIYGKKKEPALRPAY
jgi:hypothetical protein